MPVDRHLLKLALRELVRLGDGGEPDALFGPALCLGAGGMGRTAPCGPAQLKLNRLVFVNAVKLQRRLHRPA
jgi:hypothetical protein